MRSTLGAIRRNVGQNSSGCGAKRCATGANRLTDASIEFISAYKRPNDDSFVPIDASDDINDAYGRVNDGHKRVNGAYESLIVDAKRCTGGHCHADVRKHLVNEYIPSHRMLRRAQHDRNGAARRSSEQP